MRELFENAKASHSGVQGLLALASEYLRCDNPTKLLYKLQRLDRKEADRFFKDIRDLELTEAESSLLVFLSGGFPYELQLLHSLVRLSGTTEEQREALDILDSWIGGNPEVPFVPLIDPMDNVSSNRIRSNGTRTPTSTHRNTAILVGSLASAALYSASKVLRN